MSAAWESRLSPDRYLASFVAFVTTALCHLSHPLVRLSRPFITQRSHFITLSRPQTPSDTFQSTFCDPPSVILFIAPLSPHYRPGSPFGHPKSTFIGHYDPQSPLFTHLSSLNPPSLSPSITLESPFKHPVLPFVTLGHHFITHLSPSVTLLSSVYPTLTISSPFCRPWSTFCRLLITSVTLLSSIYRTLSPFYHPLVALHHTFIAL